MRYYIVVPVKKTFFFSSSIDLMYLHLSFSDKEATINYVDDIRNACWFESKDDSRINKILSNVHGSSVVQVPDSFFQMKGVVRVSQ